MNTTDRNAVTLTGLDTGEPMMFAHGYGCDQTTSGPVCRGADE
jgi:sigma-B regulation protein RsbQ